MEWLQTSVIEPITSVMYNWVLCFLLVGAGLWFTIRSRALQVRLFGRMVALVTRSGGDAEGGISSFQAFAVGLASRVGTGNIAGVAIALTIGGPGSIFWMWCVAALSMATAFVESTLAQLFKVRGPGRTFVGGPAYYIERGLGSRRWGVVFAFLLIFAFGFAFNMVQANSISDTFSQVHGVSPGVTALVLVALAAPVLFGGTQRIAKISGVALPIIAGLYLLLALVVIALNVAALPDAFGLIFRSAFGLEQAAGGVAGGLFASMVNGIKRGLFSNEGGMGSAPNAAATATVSHPAKQGLVQSLGVFVDTMVVCTATALIILVSGVYDPTLGAAAGGALTTAAVASTLGSWAIPLMSGMIFLFAFTSVLGNYSYAQVNFDFLGVKGRVLTALRILVLAAVALGALVDLEVAWSIADIAMGFMALVNLVAIVRLAPWALGALRDYEQRLRSRNPESWFDGTNNPHLPGDLPGGIWVGEPTTEADLAAALAPVLAVDDERASRPTPSEEQGNGR